MGGGSNGHDFLLSSSNFHEELRGGNRVTDKREESALWKGVREKKEERGKGEEDLAEIEEQVEPEDDMLNDELEEKTDESKWKGHPNPVDVLEFTQECQSYGEPYEMLLADPGPEN